MIDFPRAWQLTRATPKEQHDPKCSWRTHGMLCDCDVIYKSREFLSPSFYSTDRKLLSWGVRKLQRRRRRLTLGHRWHGKDSHLYLVAMAKWRLQTAREYKGSKAHDTAFHAEHQAGKPLVQDL